MRIRTEVIIGTIITSALVAFGYMEYATISKSLQPPSLKIAPSPAASTDTTIPSKTQPNTITLTPSEVAKHSTNTDCWLIMEQNVYDVTNYLRLHPGGAQRIIPYCGKDATSAFATQGGKGSHSASASQQKDMLNIGSINQTTDTTVIQQVQQNTTQQMQQDGRRNFENEDDD